MTQDEAYHCLLIVFNLNLDKEWINLSLETTFKTDVDYVLKAAHPETVYGALHEWAKGKE